MCLSAQIILSPKQLPFLALAIITTITGGSVTLVTRALHILATFI